MIYITGDTHGLIEYERLKTYFKQKYTSKKDYLIILGDTCIVWDKENFEKTIFNYQCLGPTIFYIDGNHENFDMLNEFPIVHKNNAKVHVISEHIYHVLRGELLIINNLKFLCLGGAESIDKNLRKEGVSWWPEESISEYDTDHALFNIEISDLKTDYILTHSAPSSIHVNKLNLEVSSSVEQLDRIEKHVYFKHWFFGHYHIDKEFNDKYRCFYKDIIEIPSLDCEKEKINYRELCGFSNWSPSKYYPYLYNRDTGRITKLTKDDLPEWYFENFEYYPFYYCLKDVVDIAYKGSPFDNHINKDSRIYLSYSKPIDKNINYTPVNEAGLYSTWRCNVVKFVAGLAKYSPNLDLTKIKEKINLTYDQYNRNTSNYTNGVEIRPYPEIETEILEDIKYRVKEGENILSEFYDFETARKYANTYVSKNLGMQYFRVLEIGHDSLAYDTSHNMNMWVKIIPLFEGKEYEIGT